jgi:hypothetical protein
MIRSRKSIIQNKCKTPHLRNNLNDISIYQKGRRRHISYASMYQYDLALFRIQFHSINYCPHMQGWTGHITRWEKSHGASLDWGPLSIMAFFLDQLNLWKFLPFLPHLTIWVLSFRYESTNIQARSE